MASIGKWLSPIAGSCPGLNWLKLSTPCPDRLLISSASTPLAFNFAGRGKVGLTCGGSDSYFTSIGGTFVEIDVWKAKRDGIWTSSVTVDVYLGGSSITGGHSISAKPSAPSASGVTKSGISSDATSCGTNIKATVTVNDDGTFSIA